MGTTTFSGPIRSGTIREGASANLGKPILAQSATWEQAATAADTGINIPANSQIIDVAVYITTACDGGSPLSCSQLWHWVRQSIPSSSVAPVPSPMLTRGRRLVPLICQFTLFLVLALLVAVRLPCSMCRTNGYRSAAGETGS